MNTHGLNVLCNGAVHPVGDPLLPASGIQFSSNGVYDTIRAYAGKLPCLERHLDRLFFSCGILGYDSPVVKEQWQHWGEQLLRLNGLEDGDARVRFMLLFGDQRKGSAPRAIVFAEPVNAAELDAVRACGRKAGFAADLRAPGAGIYNAKNLNFAATCRAMNLASQAGCDEVIFLNTSGEACEASYGNVCCAIGGKLVAPPIDSPCLPGITQQILFEGAERSGIECSVRPITRDELLHSEEVFTTSSVSEITPIVAIDGHPVGDGTPGPVAARMQQIYRNALFY